MARSYLPSKVSEIVAIWRKDLNKVSYDSCIVDLFITPLGSLGLVMRSFPFLCLY